MRYTKSDLEKLISVQLQNLNTQAEHIRLIKEQNEILVKYNHKLIEELSEKLEEPKPYPIPKKRKKP
jgi:hypothetical protein